MAYLEELLPEFRKGAKIRCSDWEPSIYIKQQGVVMVNNHDVVCSLSSGDVISDRWEFYQEPEPDWQYIIDHKCLCWFWGKDERCGMVGFLTDKGEKDYIYYECNNTAYYKNCRPVRRDEVTFYEDRKDE